MTVSRGELQRRAMSGSLWTSIHSILAVPTAFAANAVVARVLGPSDYGQLAFFTIALGLVTQVTHVNFSGAATQWGAAARAGGSQANADMILRKSLGFHVVVQLPIMIVAVLVIAHGQSLFIQGVLIIPVVLSAILSSVVLSLYIDNRSADTAKLAIASNLLIQASVVATALLNGTPAGLWATRSVAGSVLLPLNVLLLAKLRRKSAFSLALPRRLPRGFWRYALSTWVAGLATSLVFSRSELIVLSATAPQNSVGIFALAFGIATQITAPVDALLGPLFPAIAALVSEHPESARPALLRCLRLASLLSGAIMAVLVPLFCLALTTIYGNAFGAAVPIFLVLALASGLQSICDPVGVFTQARRRTDVYLRASLIALAVDGVAAFALIVPFGVWGAAGANVLGFACFFGLIMRHEFEAQSISFGVVLSECRSYLVGVLAGATGALLPVLMAPNVGGAVIAAVVGGLVYRQALVYTGSGLSLDDADAIVGALPSWAARSILWSLPQRNRASSQT